MMEFYPFDLCVSKFSVVSHKNPDDDVRRENVYELNFVKLPKKTCCFQYRLAGCIDDIFKLK